jgi:tetratricopeptide (TPR) repeat protein/RIO-like serine/threonine protein kinase
VRGSFDRTQTPDDSLGDRSAFVDGSIGMSDDDSFLREVAGAPPRSLGAVHLLATGAIVAGKYRIEEKIGAGGMGAVFRATDLRLQRMVAIKVHHSRAMSVERLRREARLLARLSHPNVVTVMEVGVHEGAPFVAMEYVAGVSARVWAREPGRTWREIVALYVQAARGLAAAHALGIVHRDFKPDNLLVGTDGRARVADFGLADEDLASAQDLPLARVLESMGVDTGSQPTDVTAAGSLVGTPAYVAPEQIRSSRVDARADQFSFCASLFEALYGELPFPGDSALDVLSRISAGELEEPARRSSVPRWLHLVVCRGLSHAPERRFADMDALREALAGPRSRRAAIAAGALVVGGGVALALSRDADPEPRCATDAAIEWTTQREAVAATIPGGTSAHDAWRRLARRLDERGQAWTAAWITTCAADRPDATPLERETMAHRLDCLDEERRLTDALFETLAASDPSIVANLLASASGWGDPLACLADPASARGPSTTASPEELAGARGLRHRATATLRAGQPAQALELAEEALAEAQRTGDDVEIAYALILRGNVHVAFGRSARGEEDLKAGITLGERLGDQDVQREGAMSMVLAQERGDGRETIEWITRARRHLRRWPDDAEASVRLLVIEAADRGRRGELETAVTMLDEAETIAQQAALDADEIAAIWFERCSLATARGDYGNAISHAERGRDLLVEALGADHFRVGYAFQAIGNVYDMAGNLAEALTHYRKAFALFESPGGTPDHRRLAMLVQIATLETLVGESEHALADLDRAATLAASLGLDDNDLETNLHESRGLAFLDLGRIDEAYEEFNVVLRKREEAHGSAHPLLRSALLNVALAARSLGRNDEALAIHERAARIQTDLATNDVIAADIHHGYGFALLDAGRPEEAELQFERASKILQLAFGDDHVDHGWPALGMARVELGRGQPGNALEWIARAETAWPSEDADPQGTADLAHTKASALLAAGRKDEAIALARAALAARPGHVALTAWLETHAK